MFKAEFRENDEFRQRSLSAPLGCASGLFGRQKENRRVVRTCAIQKAACVCHGLVQTFMDLYGFVSYIYIYRTELLTQTPPHRDTWKHFEVFGLCPFECREWKSETAETTHEEAQILA